VNDVFLEVFAIAVLKDDPFSHHCRRLMLKMDLTIQEVADHRSPTNTPLVS
jgi:hypothetical protein